MPVFRSTEQPASHLHLDGKLSIVHQCLPPGVPLRGSTITHSRIPDSHFPLKPPFSRPPELLGPGVHLRPFAVRAIPAQLPKAAACKLSHIQQEALEGDGGWEEERIVATYSFLSLLGTGYTSSVAPAPGSPLCVAVTMCCEVPPPELENLVHPRLGASGEPFLDIVSTEKSYLVHGHTLFPGGDTNNW